MTTRLAVALVLGSGVAILAQTDPPAFPKSPEVRAAKSRFEEAATKARRAYDDALAAARKSYVEDLDKSMAAATKANNLDEAIRIRELKKSVESEGGLPKAAAPVREGAYAFRGHQYRVVLTEISWKEARAACQKSGGDLASLDSKDKREFVSKLAGTLQLWVGAYQDPFSKRWLWANGTVVAAESWSPGRPKDFGPFTAVFGRTGLLGDAKDQIPDCKGYVCEWKR